MRPLSPTQLSTLRRIEEHGLLVPSVTLDGPYTMACLNLPAPAFEVVRVSTARLLARDGLIAPRHYIPDPGEVVIEWEVTDLGRVRLWEWAMRRLEPSGRMARSPPARRMWTQGESAECCALLRFGMAKGNDELDEREALAAHVLRSVYGPERNVIRRDIKGAPAGTHDFDLVDGSVTLAVEVSTIAEQSTVDDSMRWDRFFPGLTANIPGSIQRVAADGIG